MWIFTKYGFLSVVCARQRRSEPGEVIDPDLLMVRARTRQHLKALKNRFPEQLSGAEIRAFNGADYAFRIFVEKAVWSRVISGLAEEIDYGNFKDEVARCQARAKEEYEGALHEIWAVMRGLREYPKAVRCSASHQRIASTLLVHQKTVGAEEMRKVFSGF